MRPIGASVLLASTVRAVPAATVDVSREAVTVLTGRMDAPATLRVWTDSATWWSTAFASGVPQWQATAILEEQTDAGTLVRTMPLRPRGVAMPVSGGAALTAKVLLAWVGAGPAPTPEGRVYASVTDGSPRWHEYPAGRVLLLGQVVTLTPDRPGESGTFNGARFSTGVRLSWTNNGAIPAPTYVLNGVTYTCQPTWGNIMVDVEDSLTIQGGGVDSQLSAHWQVYE